MLEDYTNRNLSMLMDFYELTMSNGYFVKGFKDQWAVFDMFYRKNPDGGGFSIFAGLEQLIDYIQNLHFTPEDIEYLRGRKIFDEEFLNYLADFKFKGTIEAVPEGTIVYPNTPLITITAPVIDAQLVETMLLLTINHQSLIATKANRICRAAGDGFVMEFGARRAQGADAAVYGARACYIGGAGATATVLADQLFGVKAVGTMAHSWVQFFDSEYEAFKAYAEVYPEDCTLLIDTYDILDSGVLNAIRVAKEVLEPKGYRLKGVRIDSGDLAYFSKKLRKVLDDAGCEDCTIVVSNSIDEWLINSLHIQGAKINSYGVGERMITSKSDPVFGGVYKLVAIKNSDGSFSPRIKISENVEKITNPAKKTLWRIYRNNGGYGYCDVLTLEGEEIVDGQPIKVVDPKKPWKEIVLTDFHAKKLQKTIFKEGQLVYEKPSLDEIKAYVADQLANRVWIEEQRMENPHIHYVDLSEKLYNLKESLLESEH
ncbi:Nicotinate phosphoribosyltransferase [Lachnospiraceae bacterium TWA4]|nr:Nicotinate phosphoribosyltransferase [Lachnospiraceae bacterium TWA4]